METSQPPDRQVIGPAPGPLHHKYDDSRVQLRVAQLTVRVMAISRRYRVFFVACALALLACLFWCGLRKGSASPRLSVAFVGVTNNPAPLMSPSRISLAQGATGLCAMFEVANIGKHGWIWFDTTSVEQKTDTGWKRVETAGTPWSGVEGGRWTPGYDCLIAVGWPPGVATNSTWRLQVRYGPEPSVVGIVANELVGRTLFLRGEEEGTVASSEVKQ